MQLHATLWQRYLKIHSIRYIYTYIKCKKKILYSITKISVPIFNIVFNVSNEKKTAIYKVISIN